MSKIRPVLLLLLVTACGGGSSVTTPPPPPPPAPVVSVTLSQTAATLTPTQTVTLVATTKDATGSVLTGRTISWASSAAAVASVSSAGLVTGVTPGTASITATSEGQVGTATITVNPGAFVGPTGGTATAPNGNATATIPAGALSTSLAITVTQVLNPQADAKLAPGTAYDFGPTGTTFASPVTLAIKYDPTTLAVGTNQAQLRLHKLIGTTWTPLAGSTVNTVTHIVSGTTSSFSTYAVLEVLIPVGIVAITPNPVDLPLGMQVQLTATTKDAQGNVLTGRTVTWQSSVSGTATISATGLVTSNAIGATVVTATSEGIPTTMTLNVRSDPSARTLSLNSGGELAYAPGIGLILTPSTTTACAIGADQRGYCWGANTVGDGTAFDRPVPTQVALSASLVAITAGQGFSCGLDTAHNPWCWGASDFGIFGSGTLGSLTPVVVGGGRQFIDLAAGMEYLCGIDVAGGTYCWGDNRFGNLGNGTTSPTLPNPTPVRVSGDPGFVRVSVGASSACGLRAVGTVYCWGSPNSAGLISNLTVPTLVAGVPALASISVGATHYCGLTMGRQLYCWGLNESGQLGDGTTVDRWTPALVSGGMSWRFVSAGAAQTCAITTDNRTFCWGYNYEGQVGNGTVVNATLPVQVGTSIPSLAVVAAGALATCGLTVDGSGYCWGQRGVLGDGAYTYSQGPGLVVGAVNATDVARGSPMGCYVNTTKLLMCWAETEDATSAHVPSFGALAVRAVAASSSTCVILDSNSRVSCWGDNSFGQLGNGTTIATTQPTPINSTSLFTSIAVGSTGACGITTLKALFCWGGFGTVSNPVQVQAGTNWTSVWGGGSGEVCAISDQAAAYCGSYPGPLNLIPGSRHWLMMVAAAGSDAFPAYCGLDDGVNANAYCQGANFDGEVGDGTRTSRATPVAVSGGLHFSQIVAGGRTVCGLSSGLAYCWGSGTGGELGYAPGISTLTPLAVPGGLHFTKLSSATIGTCGLTTDALVYCWGTDLNSALGNGDIDDRRTPVPMLGGLRFLLYEPGTVGLRAKVP